MATETEKLKLVKPAGGDYVDVGVLNENMDKIDQFAEQIDGEYLPLTGGTLSGGEIGLLGDYGAIHSTENGMDINVRSNPNKTEPKNMRQLEVLNNSYQSDVAKSLVYKNFDANGNVTSYFLFGQHNLKSTKIRTECDSFINNYVTTSMTTAQFLAQMEIDTCIQVCSNATMDVKITDLPFNYGMIVFRKGGTASYQTAIGTSTEGKIYVYIHTGHSTDAWQELGGGGMRVPIAYNKGSVRGTSTNPNTFTLSGKGTVWLNCSSTSAGYLTLTVDGTTIINNATFDTFGGIYSGTNGNYNDGIPFDFEKSFSMRVSSVGTGGETVYYTYQLYK